jgi:hypothetical protein
MEPEVELVRKWIIEVVVGLNFCPFAAKPLKTGKIHFSVNKATTLKSALETFAKLCSMLDENDEVDTAIVVLPDGFDSFQDYLHLVDCCEQLITKEGFEGTYQVASFHPKYVFQGSGEDDPANYTNRSPFPLLHILREEMIESALEKYPHPEKIPENNIEMTRKLGLEHMKSLFLACLKG